MAKKFSGRRQRFKAIAMDKKLPMEERFAATLKLAELPRNSAPNPYPQSLRTDGPPASRLPQAPSQPYRHCASSVPRA